MSRRRYDREILALALPALGALIADPLVSLIDTAFVGRLGALPLAALGVNVAIFSFAFVVFNFLAYGTTPMVGRALGAGDPAAAGRVVANAFWLAAALGVAMVVLLQTATAQVLAAMGVSGEMAAPAATYLRIRAWAGPALLFITAANGAFRGFQDTRTPFLVALAIAGTNLVLDPLLIFVAGWGLAGAAWATVAAQWLGAVWFLALVFGRLRARWQVPLAPPVPREVLPFLRVGWALLIRTAALVAAMTAATAVAARIGVTEVAAHQVAAQLWMMLALLVDALAVAAQALVAKHVGAGRPQVAREVSDRLLVLGGGVGVALGAAFLALSPWLPRLFTDDPAVLAATAAVMPFVALMQPLNALVFVWDGVFIGVQDFSYLALAMVLSAAAAALLLAVVLPLGLGLAGVWWALVGLMLVRAGTLSWRYRPAYGPFRRAA